MKKRALSTLLAAFLAAAICFAAPEALLPRACAAAARPILVTAYRQVGWGDNVQVGYVDEAGSLWFLHGQDNELKWPYDAQEQLEWLASAKGFERLGALESDDLFVLNSLVQCVEPQDEQPAAAANDAGTETSCAVRYGTDGAQVVLLGMSGDDRYENTDASAQALYKLLRGFFPDVQSYFGNPRIAPTGFQPVSLMDFCGVSEPSLRGLRATQTELDCEAGALPADLSQEDAADVAARLEGAHVVGKYSCVVTTGGSTAYAFWDENGKQVASFEFYRGMLATQDGMYLVEYAK